MRKSPVESLRDGIAILDSLLQSYGFKFQMGGSGHSSGGPFAFGNYVSGERKLELHYRHSLGLVTYHYGDITMDHESYMRAILGSKGGNRYPGFSDEPLAPFEGLKFDLENFASAFLIGDKKQFAQYASIADKWHRKSGVARLP